MNIYMLLVLAIISAVLASYIKSKNAEFALVFSVIVAVLILTFLLDFLYDILENIKSFGVDEKFLSIPIKLFGINLLGSLAKSACEEAGEKSLTNVVSLAVKIICVVISLPLFETLLEQIRMVLNL